MHRLLLIATCVIGLAVPATALAQDPTEDAYNPTTRILGEVGTVNEAPSQSESAPTEAAVTPAQPLAADTGGSLPFTGTDVLLLTLGGAMLLGLGLGLRRFSHTS